MEIFKQPAYPQPMVRNDDGTYYSAWEIHPDWSGFTKLERASLMIAQGLLSSGNGSSITIDGRIYPLHEAAVVTARAVLEEANK